MPHEPVRMDRQTDGESPALFRRFPIRYRRPKQTPIQLFLTKDQLLISCNFRFGENMARLRPAGCDQTYAELVADGIRSFWSGDYWLPLPEGPVRVHVDVAITCGPHRRAAPIRLRQMLFMPPHVSSPWYRRFWGVFKTGQLESLGENWSREQPGGINLPFMQDPDLIRRIAAHEAGHLFGIGDAYGAIYRFYDAAPGTERYMMHANWAVQPEEILMMLRAHMTNRMQFFPRHFQWARFRAGFRTDMRQRLAEAEARLEQRRQQKRARTRHDLLSSELVESISPTADEPDQAEASVRFPLAVDNDAICGKSAVVEAGPSVDNDNAQPAPDNGPADRADEQHPVSGQGPEDPPADPACSGRSS